MRRLFRGYFTEGRHLARHEVLAELAADVGLDRAAALEVVSTGAFEAEVAADQRAGREIGVSGVPFFVLDGRFAIAGAQPVKTFVEALNTAWAAKR